MRPFTYLRHDGTAPIASGSRFLAGGTTLIDLMKLNVETPAAVVDLAALDLPGLREIVETEGGVRIGALVTMADAAEHSLIAGGYPLVAQSLTLAASQQLRNMATIGGNILQRTRCPYFRDISYASCNKRRPGSGCSARDGVNRMHAVLGTSDDCVAAYPGDFAQALIAVGGHVETARRGGTRRIPFAGFHRPVADGPHRETVLAEDEIVTAVFLPAADFRRSLYLKVRDRESYEFAAASAAVALTLDESGGVSDARIALGGVAYRPWRAPEAEQVLLGAGLTQARAGAAAEIAFRDARPLAHNGFKVALGKRTLVEALLRARALEV
ncbi:MAG: xanthine dehydrogenase family protein subunit M [Parvibaculaceae bacterium]